MQLKTVQGYIQESQADTLVVNMFEGVAEPVGATAVVDKALQGAIGEMITSGELTGKSGEVGVVYTHGAIPARRVLVTGLGKPEALDLEAVRRASAAALKRARELKGVDVATVVHGGGAGKLDVTEAAQATAEGALLGLYTFDLLKSQVEPKGEIQTLAVVEAEAGKMAAVEGGVKLAEVIAQGVYLTRDLVNLPPNMATPSHLAAVAQEIADAYGMHITVGDREWAEERRMGAFLGVAKGTQEPPRFIVLEHNAHRTDLDTIVLVGKGITFDSGGISLKPGDGMEAMKSDMAGAAAVLGTMKVMGLLDMPLHVVGIAPCTDNMPSGTAIHPADVLTASNGKTIEIISTDAEGRLILADALVYAQQYQPRAVIDLATLTGACVVALGSWTAAGIFCTEDGLRDKLLAAGARTHERLWPLPLFDDYKKAIRSNVADMKNSGGRFGGVGTSAIFLKEFTNYPWAHLDIAGMALVDKQQETPYTPAGGSGYGVRLLVEFLRNW